MCSWHMPRSGPGGMTRHWPREGEPKGEPRCHGSRAAKVLHSAAAPQRACRERHAAQGRHKGAAACPNQTWLAHRAQVAPAPPVPRMMPSCVSGSLYRSATCTPGGPPRTDSGAGRWCMHGMACPPMCCLRPLRCPVAPVSLPTPCTLSQQCDQSTGLLHKELRVRVQHAIRRHAPAWPRCRSSLRGPRHPPPQLPARPAAPPRRPGQSGSCRGNSVEHRTARGGFWQGM